MMNARRLIVAAIAAALMASAGCDEQKTLAGSAPPPPPAASPPPPAKTYDYTQTVRGLAGRKWTVAILRFGDTKEVEGVPFGAASQPSQNASGQVAVNVNVGNGPDVSTGETPPRMNKQAREVLKNELVKSQAFTVVERERILEILREINFNKTKYVNPDTAPQDGAPLAVRYLIEGSLGFNEDKTLKDHIDAGRTYKDAGDYQPGLFDNIFNPAAVNREKLMLAIRKMQEERAKNRDRARFNVSCYLSIYDVRTGEVAASVMGIGSNGLEAIGDAVDEFIDSLSVLRADVYVAAMNEGKVYLDAGFNGGIKVGDRFRVVHQGQAIRNKDGQLLGYDEKETGELEVTETQALLSIAKIVNKAGDIARGDLAKPAKK